MAKIIVLGLDVHAESITVVRQIDGGMAQPAQKFSPAGLLEWVTRQKQQAEAVWTCYEAGPFGYARRPDEIAVVLTDMMMPIMDGPATIHALLQINPEVRIVAASGLGSSGGEAEVARAGISHFLTKPYTAGTLLNSIRAILVETPPDTTVGAGKPARFAGRLPISPSIHPTPKITTQV